MEDRKHHHRFGARRHAPTADSYHASNSGASRYSYKSNFSITAGNRSIVRPTPGPTHHHNGSWEDNRGQEFDFSRDEPREGSHAPKYMSNRPKASGRSISAPGSSIISTASYSSLTGVADEVLVKGFIPPKQQHDFLSNLTKHNTIVNRGPGSKSKMLAYSSLEDASGPAPTSSDVSSSSTRRSRWMNMRVQQLTPTPRVTLAPRKKRVKIDDAHKTSSPVNSHYALRNRTKSTVILVAATHSVTTRDKRLTNFGKRRMNSEGSAAKPIALDSDSEADAEAEVLSSNTSSSMKNVDEVRSDTTQDAMKAESVVDVEDIVSHAMVQILNCDVMIGLFQCIVDMFFQGDRMCMRNIRGKYESWPFKDYYLLEFEHLQDVRFYSMSNEADACTEIKGDKMDCMGQLLEDASYIAFKLPMLKEADQDAVRAFYDPTGSDDLKGYIVLRPLDDTSGDNLDSVNDILRGHIDIYLIDKVQARKHLQALARNSFSYASSQDIQQQKSATEDDIASESDEGGVETVLTYPLPPCTIDVVTIVRHDVSRLQPKRYLNDNIIDYYFKRMMLETFRDNELIQEKVLFLSSHFYSRLRAGKGSTASARMEAGYKNVSTWLARSNLFDRTLIFIPINKDVHWSLAVILNPGVAGNDPNDEKAFTCIAVLDPLGSYHRKTAIIRNLRAFLRMQWQNSQERSSDTEAERIPEYGVDRVLPLNVKPPLQENSYDCGVYVLKFAEVVLKNCLDLGLLAQNDGVISKDVTDNHLEALITSSAFSAEDITATRKQIQQYIEIDTSEYQERKKEKTFKS